MFSTQHFANLSKSHLKEEICALEPLGCNCINAEGDLIKKQTRFLIQWICILSISRELIGTTFLYKDDSVSMYILLHAY